MVVGVVGVVIINGGNVVAGMIMLSKIRCCGDDCNCADSQSLTCCVLRVMWRRCRLLVALFRVACCVLRVACCVLRVACCVLRVACCVLRVVYYVL